jgi:uncharacterized membrane protein YhiD involved in acid resistance
MEELIRQLTTIDDAGVFTLWDMFSSLILSFILSLIIAKLYKATHRGISYTQSFVHSIVLMTVVVSMIMLIIGSNIARAFTLVGALSIIRFRNAVKETKDVAFLFFAMAVGMACGTRFYMMAVFFTMTVAGFMIALFKMDVFAREINDRIMMIQVPDKFDYERSFDNVFRKHFNDVSLISMESIRNENLVELVYSVSIKKRFQAENFLDEARRLNDNNKVTLIEGQQQLDL